MDQHKGLLEAALDAVNAVEARAAGSEGATGTCENSNSPKQSAPETLDSPPIDLSGVDGHLSWISIENLPEDDDLAISFSTSAFDNFLSDEVLEDIAKGDSQNTKEEKNGAEQSHSQNAKSASALQENAEPESKQLSETADEIAQLKEALESLQKAHAETEGKLRTVYLERDALSQENQKLIAAQKHLNDKLTRLTSDFDNYRKRVIRDQELNKNQAEERIVTCFLPVMDNLERALVHAKQAQDYDKLLQGVEMTGKLYLAALAKLGCIPFDSMGEICDPVFHDVLQKVVNNDVPNNSIIQEHLKGYIMHERVLRPALVVVAQNEPPCEGEGEENV